MRAIAIIVLVGMAIHAIGQENIVYKGDTVNQKDAEGLKQGLWVSFYEANKPESEITYVDNVPNGPCRFYYPNGKVREEGNWVVDKWVGQYKFYHPNGQPYYVWKYNESGKRSGEQKYFHNNGQVMIEGSWQNGQESGSVREYDRTGNLTAVKSYNNGQLDKASVKRFQPNQGGTTTEKTEPDNNADNQEAPPSVTAFDGNGYHKLYNKQNQLFMEGHFKDGALIDGKRFYYDGNGKVSYIEIYVNGSVTRRAKPDED
jgi:antitoxin component YwqK of YwqJK toxin-antitoxin module